MNPRLKRLLHFWSDLMKKMTSYLWGFWIKIPKIFKHKIFNETYWVSNCSISFLSICSVLEYINYDSYRFVLLRFFSFRSVSFLRWQTVCSSSTRCLYVCLLFRITVNNAELAISARTSPKTIRSQKILLHHNMSIQSKRD